MMARTINQVKNLLSHGYTKEEITSVIDYAIMEKKIDVYSFGFFSVSINSLLHEIKVKQEEDRIKEEKEKVRQMNTTVQSSQKGEVENSGESSERNREKARRLSIQSRKRTESYFDLFEE